jgi:plasmid stability protein
MTTSLNLPDDLVKDIQLRASIEGRAVDETVVELLRAGLAVSAPRGASVAADASMLAERKRIADKFVTGEWGLELAGFEDGRAAERRTAERRNQSWRP